MEGDQKLPSDDKGMQTASSRWDEKINTVRMHYRRTQPPTGTGAKKKSGLALRPAKPCVK